MGFGPPGRWEGCVERMGVKSASVGMRVGIVCLSVGFFLFCLFSVCFLFGGVTWL